MFKIFSNPYLERITGKQTNKQTKKTSTKITQLFKSMTSFKEKKKYKEIISELGYLNLFPSSFSFQQVLEVMAIIPQ